MADLVADLVADRPSPTHRERVVCSCVGHGHDASSFFARFGEKGCLASENENVTSDDVETFQCGDRYAPA